VQQLLNIDKTLSQSMALPPQSKGWQAGRLIAHLGDGPYVFGALAAAYLLGLARQNGYLQQATIIVAGAVLATMLLVTLIKFTVRRRRPHPPGEFVRLEYDRYSFPSGHAARLAALTVSVAWVYPAAGWAALLLTLGVAAARVVVGVHYLSDVAVGLLIGLAAAWLGLLWLQPLLPMPIF
jgi:undecaprenyl-diphosphatase